MKYPELSDEKWMREHIEEKNLSLRDIAKIVGCSHGGVIYSIRKFNITVPQKKCGPKPGTNMKEIATKAYRDKYPNGRFGSMAGNWRGGRRSLGKHRKYIGIHIPDHPNASSDGYVMEHRLVMEASIGRYLSHTEVVHHKNGIKHDNRIGNLELVSSRGEHARIHGDAIRQLSDAEAHIKVLEEQIRLRKILASYGVDPDQIPEVDK